MAEQITYQRPTRVLELSDGKKVEMLQSFAAFEDEEIQLVMTKGVSVNQRDLANAQSEDESLRSEAEKNLSEIMIPMDNLLHAYQKARSLAIRKLIDKDGKEYPATEENMREFLTSQDSLILTEEVKTMIEFSKKK